MSRSRHFASFYPKGPQFSPEVWAGFYLDRNYDTELT